MICLEQHRNEGGGGMCFFNFSFKLHSDQSILFFFLYFLKAELLIWQIMFIFY